MLSLCGRLGEEDGPLRLATWRALKGVGGGISQPSTTKAQIENNVLEITLMFPAGQNKDDRVVR